VKKGEGLAFYYALALSAHHGLMAQGQGWMIFIGLNVGSTIGLFYPGMFFYYLIATQVNVLVELSKDIVTL